MEPSSRAVVAEAGAAALAVSAAAAGRIPTPFTARVAAVAEAPKRCADGAASDAFVLAEVGHALVAAVKLSVGCPQRVGDPGKRSVLE